MNAIERMLSRPTAKPYRSREIEANEKPYLNDDGLLDFHPGDVENPKKYVIRLPSFSREVSF